MPTANDRPIHARANSMRHWEKAISYYMPNQNMQWNELTGHGNPTKLADLNSLIGLVQCQEIRGQGLAPQA